MMNSDTGTIGPINLGNPTEFTMHDLAETTPKLTNGQSAIQFKPLPSDNPRRRQSDISKAKMRLQWRPEVALEDGLTETIAHFKRVVGV